MQDPSSLSSILALGSLTTLVNQSIQLVEGGPEQLASLKGVVVRLRIERPDTVLYALLHDDGVEFLQAYEGPVHIRIRASLGALLQYLLMPEPGQPENIRIQGEETLLQSLGELLEYCSFWAVARGWLDRYIRINDLLQLLGRDDPAWLANLQGLPDELKAVNVELAEHRLLQEDILDELGQLRRQLRQQRRIDVFCVVIGLLLLFASLATLGGNLPQLLAHQALALGSMGAALLLSRLLSPG